jgi:hypothetical protein
MKALNLLALSAASLFTFALPADAVSISNSWVDYFGNQSDCLNIARATMRDTGHTDVRGQTDSIFADKGPYLSLIRCVAGKNMAFVVVAGDDGSSTGRILEDIKATMQRNLRGPGGPR